MQREPGRQQLYATAPKSRGTIRTKLRIHEDRAVEREVLPERGCKVRRAVADDDQLRSSSPNLVDAVAQLRDLLPAEQSAEMADEDQDDRPVLPERSESYPDLLRV